MKALGCTQNESHAFSRVLDQLTDAVQHGESVDWDAVVRQNPQFAAQLEELRPTLEILHQLSRQPVPPVRLSPQPIPRELPFETLGDFRLVREIGRGGMGIVYEAEQISMSRRVALKVLPFAAIVDDRSLQRFRNEVRAAVTLDHPNIVSIYSMGEQHGIHFYAMQLIRGQNLATILTSLRDLRGIPTAPRTTPTPETPCAAADTNSRTAAETLGGKFDGAFYRRVAHLGIRAAQALHYAHERGVVHRDVKPANLILDSTHTLYVTDFGLATIEGDAGITLTGDIVGTLRYMAPEQALGHRTIVDHRADIYSLAATLYEMLTLRPALDASNRADLLRQIAFENPIPLRRIDVRIPKELEAIVLVGLAKSADERYESAQAMANDLQRFLDNQPIQARRPSTIDYFAKWVYRNRAMASLALVACVAMMLCLLGATVGISFAWLERDRATHLALAQRDESEYHQYVADMRLASREWVGGDISTITRSLERHALPSLSACYRGWEWYFLNSLCHQAIYDLDQHGAPLRRVAFSPDGRWLASAGLDQMVRIWDTQTYSTPILLRGHSGAILSLTWSPCSKYLATGGRDEIVKVWDIEQGRVARSFSLDVGDEVDRVFSIAWSPNGKVLAAQVEHGPKYWEIVFWKTDDWTVQSISEAESDPIWTIAWSPDSSQLVSGGNTRLVAWNPATGARRHTRSHGHGGLLRSCDWSTDKSLLATGGQDGHIKLWDAKTWEVITDVFISDEELIALSWSSDNRTLAIACGDCRIHLWDRAKSSVIRTMAGHTQAVTTVDWSAKSDRLVSGSRDGTIKVWDATRESIPIHVGEYGCMALSPHGDRLATCTFNEPTQIVNLFDTATGRQVGHLSPSEGDIEAIQSLDWSHDGNYLVAAGGKQSHTTLIWRIDEPQSVRQMPGGYCAVLSPHGDQLGVAQSQGIIKVFDVGSGQEAMSFHEDPGFGSMAWCPDGRYLAAFNWNQRVHVWDALTWRKVSTFELHPSLPLWATDGERNVAWSPDGRRIAAASGQGDVVIWDPFQAREVGRFRASSRQLKTLGWSPDGKRIVAGGRGGCMTIWDPDTGEQVYVHKIDDHSPIHGVLWSPNNRQIITSSQRGVQIWDASLGYRYGQRDSDE